MSVGTRKSDESVCYKCREDYVRQHTENGRVGGWALTIAIRGHRENICPYDDELYMGDRQCPFELELLLEQDAQDDV